MFTVAALGVARALDCVSAVGRLVGDCPPLAATALLRIECEPAPLVAALNTLATLITDHASEAAAQVGELGESPICVYVCPSLFCVVDGGVLTCPVS